MSQARETVRYAVVGLGHIAQAAVLPAFEHAKENSELAALISSDDEKLSILARRYGVKATGPYEAMEDLIKKHDIHAVYLAVPNTKHREFAERAAAAGAHILCEEPMAVTEQACTAMIRAADENGVKLMIAYRLHFEEANMKTIELVRSGKLGEPRLFSSVFAHQVREENFRTRCDLGGGALFDMGIYCVNAARYLFRDEPTEVFAYQVMGTDERFLDVDEMTTGILRFPGDRVAQFTASQGAANVSEFRLVGTKGDVRLDPAYEYSDGIEQTVTVEDTPQHKIFGKRDQFAPELVYFSRCILEGLEPEPSGEEGLADVRVLEALVRSAKTRAPVELSVFRRTQRPSKNLAMKKPPVKEPPIVHAEPPTAT